jgi:hypothetical protein
MGPPHACVTTQPNLSDSYGMLRRMAEGDNVVALRGGEVSRVCGPVVPCSSTATMVLSVAEPVEVRCSLVEGHEGLHRVLMAWGD